MKVSSMIRTGSALLAVLLGTCANAQESGTPPNIVLIIGDDFGVDVTSGMYPGLIDDLAKRYGPEGHGHPDHELITGRPASTPRLDDLARQGMIFTNVWAQPFCSPTRASILTGLFASKANVLTYADPLSQQHASFVQMLKDQAGYSTALFGKWHLAGLPGNPVSYPGMKPKEAGFDVFKGNLHAAIRTYWNYDYHVQEADTPANEWRSEAPPERSLPGIAPTTFAPVVKVADAIDWITAQEEADPDKPWFVWLAYNLSHATAQQRPSAMAVPNADTLDAKSYEEMKACGGEFGSSNVGSCSGEALMRAMTNALDTVTGKLIDAVDALDPNTYVIFIGDNGTPMYGRPNLDFIDNMYITRSGRGKGSAYESGARVPLVVRGPGIEAGASSDEYVHAVDLFSTILTIAGLTPPERVPNSDGTATIPVDGVSLTPILFGDASSVRDPNEGYLLTETTNLLTGGTHHAAARNAAYKVVCSSETGANGCEFYDLRTDPLEEYPLEKPASCRDYDSGAWTPADAGWHYCRLSRIIEEQSVLAAQ
ncbi:MAG TPA: sulfatase-like hydrolase/transferase [Gammaproteobacteria bacterium]